MKKILILLLLVPFLLQAQSDEKYMAGAVPEIDGKVVFTRTLNVKEFSKEQIYTALLSYWSNESNAYTVVFKNEADGSIAAIGKDAFRVRIGLFPANVQMQYTLVANCENGNCTLEASKIKYTNNPACKESSEVIKAEDYITDKHALNKAKTKIFNGTGDYRRATINIIDSVAAEAEAFIYSYYNATAPVATTAQQYTAPVQATPQQPVAQPVQTQPSLADVKAETRPSTIALGESTEAMKQILPSDIPANLIKDMTDNGIYIIAVDGRPLTNAILGKGDMDITSDKAAAVFSVSNTDNILYLLEKADNYTLALIEGETSNKPLLTIVCKKSQQFGNMFVGEIIEVKVK